MQDALDRVDVDRIVECEYGYGYHHFNIQHVQDPGCVVIPHGIPLFLSPYAFYSFSSFNLCGWGPSGPIFLTV